MSKNWIETFEKDAWDFDQTIDSADRVVHNALLHWHLSHWHPISTVPCNQDIEVRVVEGSETITPPFPCRHTNKGEWINVDLGTRLKIQPVTWRVWQGSKSPEPHHAPITVNDGFARHHFEHWIGNESHGRK